MYYNFNINIISHCQNPHRKSPVLGWTFVRYNAACGAAVEAAAWCQSVALLQQLQEDRAGVPWKWLNEQPQELGTEINHGS